MRDVGGEAFDRIDAAVERVRHVAERAGQFADLVATRGEIRDLGPARLAAADDLGRLREPSHGFGDRAGEDNGEKDGDAQRDQEDLHDGEALGAHDRVDVAAARREHQRAEHGAIPLDRHGDRDDEFAAIIDALHARRDAAQRTRDFAVDRAVLAACFLVAFEIAAGEQTEKRVAQASQRTCRLGAGERWKFKGDDLARGGELARIENEPTILVIEARARLRRQHEAAQDGRSIFRNDGEFAVATIVVHVAGGRLGADVERLAAAALQRIDDLGFGHRGRALGDGAGDDLGLSQQTLTPCVDQAFAKLIEIKYATDQDAKRDDVEDDDAARQAREAAAQEKAAEGCEDAGNEVFDQTAEIGAALRNRRSSLPARRSGMPRRRRRNLMIAHARHGGIIRAGPRAFQASR